MNGQQLQFSEPVQGTANIAAGETAKADAMARAGAATTIEWAEACANAIELMARRGTVFQAADLIAEGLVDEPDSPSRWGPAFLRASRAGVIEPAGVQQSRRATVHRSLCRAWTGTETYRNGAAT